MRGCRRLGSYRLQLPTATCRLPSATFSYLQLLQATLPVCGCRGLDSYTVGIMGDLHLEPGKMELHEEARRHFAAQLAGDGGRVVQLGDLGGYSSRPGSR